MQLGVDVTCMHTSFGGRDPSGFGDMATFQKRPNFPFGAWTMDYDIDLVCCSCNGLKRLCKGCACVNAGRPCSNCLPDRTGRCHNRFGQSHSNESSVPEVVVGSGAAPSPSSSSPVSTLSSPVSTLSSPSLDDSVSSSQYQDSDLGSITSDAPPSFQPEATRQTSLPDFVPLADPNFQWGSMEGASFCSVIESCYNEIMRWRKNIFKVPYGNVGDAFVKELTRLFPIFFKRLASMLAAKHQKPYAHVLGWIRCRLSFSLLRSSIVCLRGARSAYHRPIHSFHSLDLALAEGCVST